MAAGYNPPYDKAGKKLLNNQNVCIAIQSIFRAKMRAVEADPDDVMREILALALTRQGDFYDEKMQPIPYNKLSDNAKAALKNMFVTYEVENEMEPGPDGIKRVKLDKDGEPILKEVIRYHYQQHERTPYHQLLMKHLHLADERVQVDQKVSGGVNVNVFDWAKLSELWADQNNKVDAVDAKLADAISALPKPE
jgi:hypothetical protein